MRFAKYYIFLFFILFAAPILAQTKIDSLFAVLNEKLAQKDFYVGQKENRINKLKKNLNEVKTPQQQYHLYQNLYEEYKTFSYDSSYHYAKALQTVASKLKIPALIASSHMKMAFTLLSSGMFKETLEVLNLVNVGVLTQDEKSAYYFLKARCYFDLADYNRNSDYTAKYNPMGIACIDSAMTISAPGSINYLELKGLKDLRIGDYADGEQTYAALLKLPNLPAHQFAINACCLSYIYEVQGLHEKSLALLIMAAIYDVESATKETVASYKLADALFKKGNIKDAYIYIKQAMDEATFYGALHRQVKISNILPIIEAQWINQIESQKRRLYIYSFIITLLVIVVVGFFVIIFRQLKKLRIADEIIVAANQSLKEYNTELEALNDKLSISNKIKNEYIGYYFNINYVYIDKLENFKTSLDKKLSNKRYEDAMVTVKTLNLDQEKLALFNTFDQVFLKMFPDFIESFNALFKPEDQLIIPDGQLLNTEMRIYALIRMGIHDNDRISKILGYSVNTIYAYKTRIKTKSIIPNDEFEDRIMQIKAI